MHDTIAAAMPTAEALAADAALRVAHPDAYKLHMEAVELEGAAHVEYIQLLIAEAGRHAPALAPMIRLLFTHVLDGRTDRVGVCCEAGQVIDP